VGQVGDPFNDARLPINGESGRFVMHRDQHHILAAGDSVILVTGGKHRGKTTLGADFIAAVSGKELRIAGILARGLWKDNLRSGFDLVNLSDGSTCPLAPQGEARQR
jgi:hypothetical protein